MPQMNKGGKFIFGKSLIREDLLLYEFTSKHMVSSKYPAFNSVKCPFAQLLVLRLSNLL